MNEPNPFSSLLDLDPVPTLLHRARSELSADFDFGRPVRISRAPGRLDVMGGIADYTGSLVCEMPLDRAAAVALQERADRDVQVFSFNLLDEHQPFTLRVPLDALASRPIETIRRDFAAPGRTWAAYLVGCLVALHHKGLIDLRRPEARGMNLALLSTVPMGAGVSSSAAVEVATMMALHDHFALPERTIALTPLDLAALCQWVENHIVGAPCGIMDQATSCYGEAGKLLRMVCQLHELQPPLPLPPGVRVVGIDSNIRHSVGGGQYRRTRCAAFMAHRIILQKMSEIGHATRRPLERDPMNGYLANLDPDDYKQLFRPQLPEWITGKEFIDRYRDTIDTATTVDPAENYPLQHAADHHVLEARRVRRFVEFLEQAATATAPARKAALDRAGRLMYASHLSYSNDAMLGAPECDLLVELVRDRGQLGLHGARITGGGSGGTVAVLLQATPSAADAIEEIAQTYHQRTGRPAELFAASTPGAWHLGTTVI